MMPYRMINLSGVQVLFHNVWPVLIGSSIGAQLAQSETWAHPGFIAAISAVAAQLAIAFVRYSYADRRDLMATMRVMLQQRDETEECRREEEQRNRHELANRAQKAEWKLAAISPAIRPEDLVEPPPLYDLRAEEQAAAKRKGIIKGVA